MKEHNVPILVTAHNANDNLETQIFNLARGCGLEGMCGIPETRPCTYGTVVRPILRMSKSQIIDFCNENGLSYVTDSTNTDTDYTRNMIRAQIIPLLQKINPSAIENASGLSKTLKEDSLCITSLTDWFLDEMNEDASFEIQKLLGSPPSIANRAVMSLYSHVSEGASLERVHVEAIRKLCERGSANSCIDLPHGICARRDEKRLYIEKFKESPRPADDFCIELSDGVNTLSAVNAQIIIGNSQITKNIYKKSIQVRIPSAIFSCLLRQKRRKIFCLSFWSFLSV